MMWDDLRGSAVIANALIALWILHEAFKPFNVFKILCLLVSAVLLISCYCILKGGKEIK